MGKETSYRVISKKNKGIVCLINEKKGKGFLSVYEKKYGLTLDDYNAIKIDDIILCSIIEHDLKYKRFQLKYLARQIPDETSITFDN